MWHLCVTCDVTLVCNPWFDTLEKFSQAVFILETLHLLQQINESKVKGVLKCQKNKTVNRAANTYKRFEHFVSVS